MNKICEHCKEPMECDPTGRERLFCSDKCRQAAYRRRRGGGARRPRRQRVTIEVATLERFIIETWVAAGDGIGAAALLSFADHIQAPIDYLVIERAVERRQAETERARRGLDALLDFAL
ncbi:MAG: hypothetical protein R3C14_28695 [Caldilineaceae bacterium]